MLRYSGGTIISRQYTADGSRQNLAMAVAQACLDAGWSIVAGSIPSSTVTMKTATAARGNAVRVTCYDPGSGNTARFILKSGDGLYSTGDGHLIPTTGYVYRIIAGPHHIVVVLEGSGAYSRTSYVAAALWLPSWLQLTPVCSGFFSNNAFTHDNTANYMSFGRSGPMTSIRDGAQGWIWQTNAVYWYDGNYGDRAGFVRGLNFACGGTRGMAGSVWDDNSMIVVDPIMIFGSSSRDSEGQFRGQLYDMMFLSGPITIDTIINYDGKQWWNLSDSQSGYSDQYFPGSVAVRIT